MKKAHKSLVSVLLIMLSAQLQAQGPRPMSEAKKSEAAQTKTTTAPAPQTVKARYEGGIFGYNKKIVGTLSFDDPNRRLVFRNKEQKEVLSLPYDSIAAAFADTQSQRAVGPVAGTVIGSTVGILGLPAMFIKRKYRYLALQYSDPDTQVKGSTSFKIDDKETLAAMLNALADKAGLTPRGEAYVRRNEAKADDKQTSPE
jgi:hypothetical protein